MVWCGVCTASRCDLSTATQRRRIPPCRQSSSRTVASSMQPTTRAPSSLNPTSKQPLCSDTTRGTSSYFNDELRSDVQTKSALSRTERGGATPVSRRCRPEKALRPFVRAHRALHIRLLIAAAARSQLLAAAGSRKDAIQRLLSPSLPGKLQRNRSSRPCCR